MHQTYCQQHMRKHCSNNFDTINNIKHSFLVECTPECTDKFHPVISYILTGMELVTSHSAVGLHPCFSLPHFIRKTNEQSWPTVGEWRVKDEIIENRQKQRINTCRTKYAFCSLLEQLSGTSAKWNSWLSQHQLLWLDASLMLPRWSFSLHSCICNTSPSYSDISFHAKAAYF